eukprot:6202452-Pleurochrysis_carterae.AAC.1
MALSDDDVFFPAAFQGLEPESARADPMGAIDAPATLPHSAEAHTTARLEKSQHDMHCLMEAMVPQLQHISTRDNAVQESFST